MTVQCWVLLPFLLFVVSVGGIWTVYAIAVANNHVCSLNSWAYNNSCTTNTSTLCCTMMNIPYVSTCGINFPESAVFMATLNIGSAIYLVVCIFRHAHVLDTKPSESMLSTIGLVFGCMSSAGGFLVGNCNPRTLMIIHYLGAALSFAFGLIYIIIQTLLTYRVPVTGYEVYLAPLRVILTAVQIMASLCYTILFAQIGLHLQQLSAVFEWLQCTNMHVFLVTLIFDFHCFRSSMLQSLTGKRDEEKALIISKDTASEMYSK